MNKNIVSHETAIDILTNIADIIVEIQAPYKAHQDRLTALKAVVERLEALNKLAERSNEQR